MQAKRKRVVVKEELVALTGCTYEAIVLNQLLYWVQRCYDYRKFLDEERRQAGEQNHGWIYKSAAQLHDELMLTISPRTLARLLTKLVDAGWLARRHNPNHRWDRRWQYRPNVRRIQQTLAEIGYALDRFPELESVAAAECRPDLPDSDRDQTRSDGCALPVQSNRHAVKSIAADVEAIPEITLKIKPKKRKVRSTTTKRRRRAANGGGGRCNPEILDICDQIGIYEPKRSLLARLPHVIRGGPDYVTDHVENAPSLACAIWRMEAGWKPRKPKPANDIDWESIIVT